MGGQHLNTLTPKLSKALALLAKSRHYVLLYTICFSLFNSHLIYACQIWAQREDLINKISPIQGKAIRTIKFKELFCWEPLPTKQNPKIKGLCQTDKFYVCKKCSRRQSPKNIYKCILKDQ